MYIINSEFIGFRSPFSNSSCGFSMLELALLGMMIQQGSERNANKVLTRDGDCSVNPTSQGYCTGVFIGA
jgi:hypothetical protein